jgi:hypothetical protein
MAKTSHYNNIILNAKNKMKATWKIKKKKKGMKQLDITPSSLKIKDTTIKNKNIIANTFNNYFATIADNITAMKKQNLTSNINNPINYLYKFYSKPFCNIKWHYASTHEITKIIKSLKTKDSCGYDEITSKIIKISEPFIISPLTHICNAVLCSGKFPDRLKYAIVKPIYKVIDRKLLIIDLYLY